MRSEKNWPTEMILHFESYLGTAVFCFVFIILMIQVFCRYILGISFAWIEEVSIIGYVILIYCGVSGAVLTRQNMRIDMVLTFVPFMARKVMMIIDAIIHATFTAWLTYYLYSIIQNMMKVKSVYSVTRMPKVYVYAFIAVMLILSVVRAVHEVIKLAGESKEKLGKAKPAFDLDAIWEEGLAVREAYIAQQKENGEDIKQ